MNLYETEIAAFESNTVINLTQYGGYVRQPNGTDRGFNKEEYESGENGNQSLSHQYYRATDITTTEAYLYAPCALRCVYHDTYTSSDGSIETGAIATLYETIQPVRCADGVNREFTLVLFHEGDSSIPEVGKVYYKGEVIYKQGIQGLAPNSSPHIHMDILRGIITNENHVVDSNALNAVSEMIEQPAYNSKVYAIKPTYSFNFHEIFYGSNAELYGVNTINLWTGSFTLTETPKHGWRWEADNWYYYQYGIMFKGWLCDIKGDWYFLDYDTGIMRKGWVADGSKWYFMHTSSGVMQKGWIIVNDKYYYLQPDTGEMAVISVMYKGKLYTLGSDGALIGEPPVGVFPEFEW